jgi:hypothetical protein
MYTRSIARATPGYIIFLVDHSASMSDEIAGSSRPKIEAVATAINRFIGELIAMCEKGEEKPRHYFDVSALGFTTDHNGVPVIESLFAGPLAGQDLVSVVDLYDYPLDFETRQRDDGAGGLVEFTFPVWFRTPPPENMAGTPMCGVLDRCFQVAQEWCRLHPQSTPPMVILLTDGESTDGNPEPLAERLRSLTTEDGNLLLFICHLSASAASPVLFPLGEEDLPDDYGRKLFRMSSELPARIRHTAELKNLIAPTGAHGLAFNADGVRLLQLISVGTTLISVGTVIAAPFTLR